MSFLRKFVSNLEYFCRLMPYQQSIVCKFPPQMLSLLHMNPQYLSSFIDKFLYKNALLLFLIFNQIDKILYLQFLILRVNCRVLCIKSPFQMCMRTISNFHIKFSLQDGMVVFVMFKQINKIVLLQFAVLILQNSLQLSYLCIQIGRMFSLQDVVGVVFLCSCIRWYYCRRFYW